MEKQILFNNMKSVEESFENMEKIRLDIFNLVLKYCGGSISLIQAPEIARVLISLGVDILFYFFNQDKEDTFKYLFDFISYIKSSFSEESCTDFSNMDTDSN